MQTVSFCPTQCRSVSERIKAIVMQTIACGRIQIELEAGTAAARRERGKSVGGCPSLQPSSVSLFGLNSFLRPGPRMLRAVARRGCRRLAVALRSPETPTLPGHALTAPSTAAHLKRLG
jgi:hypothetical protein